MTDTSKTVTAIAERRDDLANLVSNTNTTFGAIAAARTPRSTKRSTLLPDTLRKANTTFVNLRSTLDDLDKLVAVSKPATKDLAPFLRELRPLVHEAQPTIADLNTLIRKPGPEQRPDRAHREAAAAGRASPGPCFPRAIKTLNRAQPVFEYARSYTPDLAAWLANFGQLAANYDANGHYARVQPMFLPSTFSGGTLTANQPSQKLNGFDTGNLTRCPGGDRPARARRLEPGAGRQLLQSTSSTPPGP